MISILTEKVRVPGSSSDFASQIYAEVSNDAAKSFAADLQAGDLPIRRARSTRMTPAPW